MSRQNHGSCDHSYQDCAKFCNSLPVTESSPSHHQWMWSQLSRISDGWECQCQSEKIRGAPSLVNPDYSSLACILVWALFKRTGLMSSQVISTHRALVKRPECLPGFSNQVSGMRLSKRVKIRPVNFLCTVFLFRSHICTSCHDWAILSLAHDSWYSKRESYHQIPVTT